MAEEAKKKNRFRGPDLDIYLEGREKRYTTYALGARMYSLNYYSFVKLAKKAGANIQIKKNVIVDLDILEAYLAAHTGEQGGDDYA